MRIVVFKKRVLLIVAALIIAFSLGLRLIAVPTSTKPVRDLPIYSVGRDDNAISVTFDCAWNDSDIDQIIQVLDKYKCSGTFFVVGTWAEKYPDAVKKLNEAGHEISNHSYNHAHYSSLSKDSMKEDMNKCDAVIENLTSKKTNLFRAPYGEYNNSVVQACIETNRFCIQWDVDTFETKLKTL